MGDLLGGRLATHGPPHGAARRHPGRRTTLKALLHAALAAILLGTAAGCGAVSLAEERFSPPPPASTALPPDTVQSPPASADLAPIFSIASRSRSVAPADTLTSVRVGGLAFKAWSFAARDVPAGSRPFDWPTPGTYKGDPDKVSLRIIEGVAYNFPLRQAETGYHALNSYRLTGDKRRLRHAEAQAQNLIATRVVVGDAWFYPSDFFYRFNDTRPEALRPPWYQGLAQGLTAGFFARLYETTGKSIYRTAAAHTLASLLVAERPGRPWVSRVDGQGYLRVEEYPASGWRFVFNGHMQAALGLWDYHRVFGDDRALALYRGALTSVVRYGEDFRTPHWISAYSLGARALFIHYHVGVMNRMLQLYRLSGDPRFVHLVNHFDDDYPPPVVSGVVALSPGTYTLRRFSAQGAVLGTRRLRVAALRHVHVDRRRRVQPGGAVWLRISAGGLKGYSLRERAGRVYVRGAVDVLTYNPAVPATLRKGAWQTVVLGASSTATPTHPLVVASAQETTVSRRGVVNGRRMVQLNDESGSWIPARAVSLP